MNNFTDQDRLTIAEQEYKDWNVNDEVIINGVTIGYVAKVINNKETGEQSFIITDGNPSKQKAGDVKSVVVLYRGSTAPGVNNLFSKDVRADWLGNDAPIAQQIVTNKFTGPTPQLVSSSETLDKAMKKYGNALFDVYGHSLGSMNGQYALANAKYPERIRNAYLYEGPNIYGLLTKDQKKQADGLKKRIYNYIDLKDKVPIGYDLKGIGIIVFIDSKDGKDLIDQHMWGGYQFDGNGNLRYPQGKMITVRTAQTEMFIADQMRTLGKLAAKLQASGGTLSASEQVYLDSESTLAVSNGVHQLVEQAVIDLESTYNETNQSIEKIWPKTLKSARSIGGNLNEAEIIEALQAGGCNKQTLVDEPIAKMMAKLTEIKAVGQDYKKIVDQIKSGVEKQLAADQDLARQVAE